MPFAQINDITTWYQDIGQGSDLPVLFADHRIWEGVTSRLSATRRCVAYDKRGHGLSDVSPDPYAIADLAADLLALADHRGIERFVIVDSDVIGASNGF